MGWVVQLDDQLDQQLLIQPVLRPVEVGVLVRHLFSDL